MAILKAIGGFLKRHGPHRIRHYIWDKQYRDGYWNRIEQNRALEIGGSVRDPVYEFIEHYGLNNSILDLGCGSGTTAMEMADVYSDYVGVDVSDFAIQQAISAVSLDSSRKVKTAFVVADIATYVPRKYFSVILFRESIYYLPKHEIKRTLARYATFLVDEGVFIIRVWDRLKHKAIIDLTECELRILDRYAPLNSQIGIVVGSPFRAAQMK